jgi:hypothetical protein
MNKDTIFIGLNELLLSKKLIVRALVNTTPGLWKPKSEFCSIHLLTGVDRLEASLHQKSPLLVHYRYVDWPRIQDGVPKFTSEIECWGQFGNSGRTWADGLQAVIKEWSSYLIFWKEVDSQIAFYLKASSFYPLPLTSHRLMQQFGSVRAHLNSAIGVSDLPFHPQVLHTLQRRFEGFLDNLNTQWDALHKHLGTTI